MTMGREVVEDYRSKGLSLRAHPVAFLRESLAQRGYAPCSALRDVPNGRRISITGLILVRQMPGSAKGVMFMTLEDESANGNIIVWPSVTTAAPSYRQACWAAGAKFSAQAVSFT
jgi:error-prone DNA polymerase